MIRTEKYQRKTFFVDGIRVTAANLEEVAEWCGGTIELDENSKRFIKVRVYRPATEKQTRAFVGDWVLYAGVGYKVYTNKAFHQSFESIFKDEPKVSELEAGVN